jgi:hypothetical protein
MFRRVSIELPPPDTKHWTMRRKAAVVEAVRIGMISAQEACLRYNLSIEEFLSWLRAIEKHGVYGLWATRVQIYRGKGPGSAKNKHDSRALSMAFDTITPAERLELLIRGGKALYGPKWKAGSASICEAFNDGSRAIDIYRSACSANWFIGSDRLRAVCSA